MDEKDPEHGSAAELLAAWRAAGRDTVAAHGAAKVAEMALTAAAAEEAATEVDEAASAAVEAAERAPTAASRARVAAQQAAEAAHLALATAEGKARANHDVDVAEHAEEAAADRFHEAQDRAFKHED